jgi:hypothetical protein
VALFSRCEPHPSLKPQLLHLALIAPAMALFSCVPPKAIVVAEPAAKPKLEKPQETVSSQLPSAPAVDDDGIRLPNMLAMPGDNEFRSSRPATGAAPSSGPVIARPPVEPER